jgi:endonuclease YncB( thermonuclease family)
MLFRLDNIDTPETRTTDFVEKIFGNFSKERLTYLLGSEYFIGF